ncbi:hypothetical protein BDZ97DRAFT_1775180 [Flammula alnicola]|nr:hypothetical protein BDZ97DRAFT_1775180 [Flammula alnicola]
MTLVTFLFFCFQYLCDLSLLLSGALMLLFFYLAYVPATVPKIVLRDDQGVQTDIGDSFADGDEAQISFLLVCSSDISDCDINPSTNFDQTIQALVENRRRMVQRSSAARVRKERVKRAHAVLKVRHCRT